MSRVPVVFTGGTIAMLPDDQAGGLVPALDGAQIAARTPGLAAIADVEPIDWGLVPASHLRFGQLLEIHGLLERALADDGVAGAVVVQGTDTIEETAFAFDLLLRSDKPVVVTGAMRNATEPDYDGPRNLADAVRVAASVAARGWGALVVLNGTVIAGDAAVKGHSTALNAFRPRDGAAAGTVEADGSVRLAAPPPGRPRLLVVPRNAPDEVQLVTAVTGMDGTLLRMLSQTGPPGLVVAATGAGNTHPDVLAAASTMMASGTVVCLTTRCAAGHVAPAYAFPGGGAQWERAGALLTELDGPKCRVALALGLGAGLDRDALRPILRAQARR